MTVEQQPLTMHRAALLTMQVLNYKKRGLLILLFIGISFSSFGQNCSLVSGKKNKEKSMETFSGIATSTDFYNLMMQKQIDLKESSLKPAYNLHLIAASQVLLSDDIIKSAGTMEVKLSDSSSVKFENVAFSNNPLGACCSIGFKVSLTEEQMKVIGVTPIVTLSSLDLTTSFSIKKQKEQQRIIMCLIEKH